MNRSGYAIKIIMGMLVMPMLFLSCTHVAHRAGVNPGINGSLMLGPVYENNALSYDSEPNGWTSRDIQASAGYAWQFKNGHRLLFQPVINFTKMHDTEFLPAPSMDLYWQIKSDGPNFGIGFMLFFDPKLYIMWGTDFGSPYSKFRHGIDFGVGAAAPSSFIPQIMYTLRHNSWQSSLLVEYRSYPHGIFNDDEEDYLRSRITVALVFTLDEPPEK